jgi:hypothetical protein
LLVPPTPHIPLWYSKVGQQRFALGGGIRVDLSKASWAIKISRLIWPADI